MLFIKKGLNNQSFPSYCSGCSGVFIVLVKSDHYSILNVLISVVVIYFIQLIELQRDPYLDHLLVFLYRILQRFYIHPL